MDSGNDEAYLRIESSVALNDYAKLYDFEWAKKFDKKACGTLVENASRNLLSTWRGIGDTFRMPFVMVELMHRFAVACTDGESYLAFICNTLAVELGARMESKLNPNKVKQLEREIKQIARNVPTKIRPETFNRGALWEHLLGVTTFRMIQWSAQQQCFTSIYFAYEHFIVECIRCKKGKPELQFNAKIAEKLMTSSFDQRTYDYCFNDPEIDVARRCRNVLAHNGGFETDDLRNTGHPYKVIDGRICILPEDNRNLLRQLEQRAMFLIDRFTSNTQCPTTV